MTKVAYKNKLNDNNNVSTFRETQDQIFRVVLDESFTIEKKHLVEGKVVPRRTLTIKQDPFLHHKSIMKVGGKLGNSFSAEKYPVILPKKCSISEMVALWSHVC